jgi:hypothetical protein
MSHISLFGETKSIFKTLFTKPKWNRQLAGPRWDNNIKADFKEILSENVDWIRLVQDRIY